MHLKQQKDCDKKNANLEIEQPNYAPEPPAVHDEIHHGRDMNFFGEIVF